MINTQQPMGHLYSPFCIFIWDRWQSTRAGQPLQQVISGCMLFHFLLVYLQMYHVEQ